MERLAQCPLTISLTRLASSAYNRVVAAENNYVINRYSIS